jgi:hypothetical protein
MKSQGEFRAGYLESRGRGERRGGAGNRRWVILGRTFVNTLTIITKV